MCLREFLKGIPVLMLAMTPVLALAQEQDETTVFDSIAVVGADRVGGTTVISRAAIPLGQPVGFLDIQRAIETLYAMGQFEDISVSQGLVDGKQVLRFTVTERGLLMRWDVRGVERLAERTVRGKVRLVVGRPYDVADATSVSATIDSLYRDEGYFQTNIRLRSEKLADGNVALTFDIDEGERVAISSIIVEGNAAFSEEEIVAQMQTKPEGFFWFRKGEFEENVLEEDVRENLPRFYASEGYVDFQVLRDTLVVEEGTGKAVLILSVDEGPQYRIGTFEVVGSSEFSSSQLEFYYPFADERRTGGFLGLVGGEDRGDVFDQSQWLNATESVRTLYFNNGYIYADIRDVVTRRTGRDGERLVDLRWQITERAPAIVQKIHIIGNSVTHEDVIRRAIFMVPGDVFRQDALIQSYQTISNLGFFEQPMPSPRTEQANQQGDVNIIFEVRERRTGNVNFGASLGQGTGVGGFIGLDEPNMFGKGKRVSFQVQFGKNLSDFNVSYNDPSIKGGRVSGTMSLHNTRQRFTIQDLGRLTTRGGSIQFGLPFFGSRYTRVMGSYTLEQSDIQSSTLAPIYSCSNCVLSSFGASVVRDTRVGMPFAIGGSMMSMDLSQNNGIFGDTSKFFRANMEGRWYAPLSGSDDSFGQGGVQFVVGFTAKTGFIWGDAGPHFRQLFSMGGTQFGIPLRGYDEFSVTPDGYDPTVGGYRASGIESFGGAYTVFTGEIGARISQMLYLNTFVDAGNLWRSPAEFNPTRMFRSAGLGASILSPLGPLGLDYAYGFDRTDTAGLPSPKWMFHFKLGNFF